MKNNQAAKVYLITNELRNEEGIIQIKLGCVWFIDVCESIILTNAEVDKWHKTSNGRLISNFFNRNYHLMVTCPFWSCQETELFIIICQLPYGVYTQANGCLSSTAVHHCFHEKQVLLK